MKVYFHIYMKFENTSFTVQEIINTLVTKKMKNIKNLDFSIVIM